MAPIEHDDECTVFDPSPWGAQQRIGHAGRPSSPKRLAPLGVLRMSGPLQENTGVASVPALTRARRMPKATPAPTPIVEQVTSALATAIPTFMPAPRAATHPGVPAQPAASSASAMTFGVPLPSHLPAPRPPAPAFAAMAPALAHAMPGYASPALVAQYETTLPVRRSASMMSPVRLAIPAGALLAVIAMLIAYLAQPSGAHRPAIGALAIGGGEARVAMPVLEPSPSIQPSIQHAPATVVEAVAPEHLVAETAPATAPIERTRPAVKHRTKRAAKAPAPVTATTHSSRRPRKIVAVDASTPLGNLRPRRF